MTTIVKSWEEKKRLIQKLIESPFSATHNPLTHIVEEILSKRDRFLSLSKSHHTPYYAFDKENLEHAAQSFMNSMSRNIPGSSFFYAVKVNHYEKLLSYVFANGFGADVSSGRELELALNTGAQQIVFSGPGKTTEEIRGAIEHKDRVILNLDSFGELAKLPKLLKSSPPLRAGVRVSFAEHGAWEKFGIPLMELNNFFKEAAFIPNLNLCGIQFHISWNKDAQPYVTAIQQLASYLKNSLNPEFLKKISFLDIGGGFRPYNSEGYYPEDTPLGAAIQAACDAFEADTEFTYRYYITEASTIEEYAKGIGDAIKKHLTPIKTFQYYLEPGRIICNNAMHVVLQVEDIKSPSCVITNGGTNIIGFERFEYDYFPIINLTNPSLSEIPCTVYGSLCMPQDYWGHTLYASKVELGDILVVPYQGALTYANMQGFIKGEAPVFEL